MDDLVGTSSLDGKFTIQEDEEQYLKLSEILNLLVDAGYFRAKIQGLSAFDKIVGGMVWCISLCAEAVDVDLLYSENSSIGQKIALTENIVKVLPKFKCPHSIEPHQIQGLDCIRIFPVITASIQMADWLVNEAIEAKKKHGDEILRYAGYQFSKTGWSLEGQKADATPCPKPRQRPKRIFTRATGMQTQSLEEDVKCTLLEYGLETSDVVMRAKMADEEPGREKRKQIEAQFLENLQIAEKLKSELQDIEPTIKKVSARVVTEMIDSSRLEQVASDADELQTVVTADQEAHQLEQINAELEKRLAALKTEHSEQENLAQQIREQLDETNQNIVDYDQAIKNADPEVVDEAKRLLEECKELRLNEQQYKRDCRAQMQQIEDELKRLQANADQSIDSQEIDSEDANQIKDLSSQLADLNREVFYLSRQLDSRPTQIELNQYQRRFVELYNLLTAKHLEARRLCVYHNKLVDTCSFMRKEISLLNNIDDQKNLALASNYRASFLQNLEEIVRGINDNLNKISTKKQETQKRRDQIAEKLQKLQDRKRTYHRVVAEFQEECQINEQLLAEEASLKQ
ncbi:hypothetical protein M3Y97_00487500 [Aphelenchoides bicaudatus]|nr:hypothetical protein M3Y97_00487500 [Aphelenchoides bicaudatus]